MIDINISLSDNNGRSSTYALSLQEVSPEFLKEAKQLTETYVTDLEEEYSEMLRGNTQTSSSPESGLESRREDLDQYKRDAIERVASRNSPLSYRVRRDPFNRFIRD